MNSFFVIVNELKEFAKNQSVFVKNYLEDRGKMCYLQRYGETVDSKGKTYTDASSIPDDVECVIAIGGDGTLLHASRDIVGTGLPLLGINMGTLGYLAEIEVSNVTDALDLMRDVTDGSGFDMVYDTSGAASCVLQMPDLCRCGGKLMSLNLSGDAYQFILGKISFKEITLIGNRLYDQKDFEEGVRFVEDNWKILGLDRMVTDRLGLSEIHRAIEMMLTGENICKIVIDPTR